MNLMNETKFFRAELCRKLCSISVSFTLVIFCSIPALAHEGKPHTWHDLWRSWSFEPVVVISLTLTAALFLIGLIRLWRESGVGKGIRRWEALAFAGGWLALFVALVSPVHSWG